MVRILLRASPEGSGLSSGVMRAGKAGSRAGRVLVIDDDTALATAISRVLRLEHDVVLAHSGQEGIELLRRDGDFDVIVCDVTMPDVGGAEVFETLQRELPELAERLVFLTGGACTPYEAELLDGIPNRKLDKPLNVPELMSLIRLAVDAADQ